jgi:hypothetical protein
VLASTDVHLSYPSNGEAQTGIVTVKPDSPAQQWRVRTRHDHKDAPDRHVREYAYQLIHTLVDGSVITSDPVITTASTVSVADPFPGRLDIDLVPAWDSASISRVFVDIVYDDPPNAYHREERRELVGTLTDTTRVSLALRDSKQRTFTYRTTFVGTDNQVHQGEFASTSDSLLSLRSVG